MTKQLDVVTRISVTATVAQCFDYIVPISLPHIFHRYIYLPGVVRSDETQRWFNPGMTRTVYFTDRTTAQEQLLTVDPPSSFTYRIRSFTGPNRFLISEVKGAWQFSDDDAATTITWTYSLMCHHLVAYIAARIFIVPMLRNYLMRALLILKHDLEQTTT